MAARLILPQSFERTCSPLGRAGESPQRAAQKVQALALRRLAERLEGDDFVPVLEDIAFDMPYFEPVAER